MLEINALDEKDSSENKKKTKWLIALILFLILLLMGQTIAVVYYVTHKEKPLQTVRMDGGSDPVYGQSALSPQSGARAASGLRRRHVRNAYASHDPLVDDAFDSMNRLEDHLNQMLNHWMAAAPSMNDLFGGSDSFDFVPTLDLGEKGNEYIIKADLPGLDKNQIDISVKGDLLTLKGVRQSESKTADDQNGIYKQERSYGSFARSLRLPGPVDETKISADYQNGVLTIHLPKAAGSPDSKKIEIQ